MNEGRRNIFNNLLGTPNALFISQMSQRKSPKPVTPTRLIVHTIQSAFETDSHLPKTSVADSEPKPLAPSLNSAFKQV